MVNTRFRNYKYKTVKLQQPESIVEVNGFLTENDVLALVVCLLPSGSRSCVPGFTVEERVEVLEGQVSVLEDSVTVLDVEVDDVEGDLFIQSGRIDGLRDDVNLVQASVTGLDEDVETVEDSVSAQDLKIAALEETNALLLSRLELLEIQLTSLNETVGDLDIDNSTNERLDALESDVTVLQGDVTGLGGDVTVLEGTITDIQNDVTSLEDEVSDLGEVGQGYPEATFLASFLTYSVVTTDPIVFNDAIINTGGHYDATTGIYTVPVDGVYQFVVHYMLYTSDSIAAAHLVVDNDVVAFTRVNTANPAQGTADIVVIVNLTAGQDVWVQPNTLVDIYGSSPIYGMYSWFSGHLINRT